MSSSPTFSIATLHFDDAPSSPCALLIDTRIALHLPTPTRPSRTTPLTDNGTPLFFEIKSAGAHKGLGMFATRAIPTGALILVEHPAIITPANVHFPSSEARDEAYRALFDALPDHRSEELRTMTNCRPEDVTHEEGISRTNGTAVELGHPDEIEVEAREYGAVFLTINRSNHSCGPNAAHKWDLASFSSSLYALRPIAPGEEITMIYTDVTQPSTTRRAHLLSHYGFLCTCPFCTLPPTSQSASDAARFELREWRHTRPVYAGWATDLCRADSFVLDSHFAALELIRREGLEGMESAFVREVCLCYAVLGEEGEFREWAGRLEGLSEVRDPGMAKEVRGWLGDVKSVPKWGWRKKKRMQMTRKKKQHEEEEEEDPADYFSPLMF
ncbi:hypothetical protein DXG03_006524 [Asterophora parasitica]|uniref:SET domain-containing protein n=1 Tax=Asterophora parasitica TaxID=117018 RepID=A0A9P7K8C7_9AGAR|nr:hypothetical protein DXG03_006524 [Asterophora parasitica]